VASKMKASLSGGNVKTAAAKKNSQKRIVDLYR
jgi:hypothetical protein